MKSFVFGLALFCTLLPLEQSLAAEFSPIDNSLTFDAVDADGRFIDAILRAKDDGPMALGKRFVLEQTTDASATAPDATWDPATNQVLAPVVLEGAGISHSLTLMHTGGETWTVVKLISETLFGDGEDVKAMFMRGEAGPRGPQGEPGSQGPQGEQGPQGPRGWAASIPTNPSFANLNVTDTTTDQLTVTGSATAGQLAVTGAASAAQVSATGDISANRFIGNGSTLSYLPATAESNLRMVRGVVRDNGTIHHGAGFTVSRTDVGRYRIWFSPAFPSEPTPILTPFAVNGGRIPAVRHFNSSYIDVELRDASSNFVDDYFSFLCIGTR